MRQRGDWPEGMGNSGREQEEEEEEGIAQEIQRIYLLVLPGRGREVVVGMTAA